MSSTGWSHEISEGMLDLPLLFPVLLLILRRRLRTSPLALSRLVAITSFVSRAPLPSRELVVLTARLPDSPTGRTVFPCVALRLIKRIVPGA